MDLWTSFSSSGFGGRPPLFFGSSMASVYVMQKLLAKHKLLNHNNHINKEPNMNKLTINEVLKFYRDGWMSRDDAVSALLAADPVRFQRQAHVASAFIALNA